MRLVARPRAALLLTMVALLGCLLLPSRTRAEPALQAAPTSQPPTPSPTPSPPDVALAARFAKDGEYEAAIGAYLAVIQQGLEAERLAAHLALGRVYLDDGQAVAAVRQFDAYLLEAPAATDVRGAQFLLAEALTLQGDWVGALPLYDAYILAGGGATAYARLGRAEALARTGRGLEAAVEADRVLRDLLPRPVRLSFILTMAQALEDADPLAALAWYDRLGTESEAPNDDALALWRSALIQRELGDDRAWLAAWPVIIEQYPETAVAQAIVDEPPPIKILMDSYYVGLVHYRAGRYDEARQAFEVSVSANRNSGSPAARASYYLAVIDEGDGAIDRAIAGYGRVVRLDPGLDLADDALWWQARLLEQTRRTTEARAAYQRIANEYTASDWAPDARFRLALLSYDGGRFGDAARQFAAIATIEQDEARQRAQLWQGKALVAAGDEDSAEVVWRELAEDAPKDYYGLRAAALLGDASGGLRNAASEQEPDWPAIESWLLEMTQRDPGSGLDVVLYNRHWGLGKELLALGMRRWAAGEFEQLVQAGSDDPGSLYQLTRFFHSADLPYFSSRAATRLLRSLPEEETESAPADLWRLAYPAPFGDALRVATDEEDVPDLLLLAVVRQESFFDVLAGSSAGALGLTQVIPDTGKAIAADLELADFSTEDLYRPSLSLRFGAHYLRAQLDTFDGDLYLTLAAYNAGPGNVQRWSKSAGDDPDRFVEEIEFAQTKLYVQLVTENLARYRQLYQGFDQPVLPSD